MMIHLLRKCNYITTLFSDGQRPIPKAALFPNIAEKKGTILPQSRSVIKMNDHHPQYCLTLQRRLTDILEQQVWTPPEGHIPLPAGAYDGWNRSSWTRFGFFQWLCGKQSLQTPSSCGKSPIGVPPPGSGTVGMGYLNSPLNTMAERTRSKKFPPSTNG